MGVREILLEFLEEAEPSVRGILKDVLLLEQQHIDLQQPRVKADIRNIIDQHVKAEGRERRQT